MANEEKNGAQNIENEELTPTDTAETEAAQQAEELDTENNTEADNAAEKPEDTEADEQEAEGDSADENAEEANAGSDEGEAEPDSAADTNDGSAEKPHKKKHGLLIAGIAALLIAGAGAGYYYWYLPMMAGAATEDAATKTLVMPDLVYESQEVAEEIAANMSLPVDIYYVSSESVPAGLVTLQSTSAGAEVPDGESVAVYVSLGAKPTPTAELEPLPTPTPKATPKPTRKPTPVPEIVAVVPTETPCG